MEVQAKAKASAVVVATPASAAGPGAAAPVVAASSGASVDPAVDAVAVAMQQLDRARASLYSTAKITRSASLLRALPKAGSINFTSRCFVARLDFQKPLSASTPRWIRLRLRICRPKRWCLGFHLWEQQPF